jgi:GT2 family glycosyltransferase
MDISVVIVNYNVKEFLRSAIVSVERALAHGGLTGEILVVDNNSTDGSTELINDSFPNVRLWALPENIGFGRANNVALREASGDYLLILNPDTILGEDTLEVMYRFMKGHPDAGLAGCKLLNGDGSFQLSCRRGFPTPWASFTKLFGFSRFFPNSKIFAKYNLTYLPIDETYEVDALGGAFMFMSRAAYESTQGFDEQYFMYGEDLDLCYQVKKLGFKIFYVHETATIHFKGESTRRSALNEVQVFYEAMHLFVKKNYRASFVFNLLLRIGIMLRSLLALVKKHRGATLLVMLDLLTVAAAVLMTSKLILSRWLGLPPNDYPFAIVVPAVVVVAVLMALSTYSVENRRNLRVIALGIPAALIVLSSLTYFFKEYASSRSLVLAIAGMALLLLMVQRNVLRVIDRIRYGGATSARPAMKRTVVIGLTAESIRIGALLKRTQFMKHYQLVGFVDRSLSRMGEQILDGSPVLGDISMLPKIVRDQKVAEVIFANDAVSYSDMLETMQRVSEENPSRNVNFNVVPTASDVLLAKRKIESLQPERGGESLALLPVHYNIQRLSHRLPKRLLDLLVLPLLYLWAGVWRLFSQSESAERLLQSCRGILRGELSLVGIESRTTKSRSLTKVGLTSLARITLDPFSTARSEDVEQLDRYYAENHTLGMDIEILVRSVVR